ncbi:hypothetical protein ACFLW1_01165 [Chloroflexota bacterium]
MNCNRCGREISQEQSYAHQGKLVCEECLMEIGLHPHECEPWSTYLASKEQGATAALTEAQREVYEYIKAQGKAARDDLKNKFRLSEEALDAATGPLMHKELVKEHAEGGQQFLIPIK